jgi:hypothetical protein
LNIFQRLNTYIFETLLVLILILHYGGILYTNSFLSGSEISDYVNLKSNTIQTAAYKSAHLPVFYVFEVLHKGLGLSSEFTKALIAFLSLVVIGFSIYGITLCVFNTKLGGVLAVSLFLYSSLYFHVLFNRLNFIDDSNPDALAYSFLMLGLLCWLRERGNLAVIFAGLSFDCHPILPIGFILVFLTYQLVNYKRIGVKQVFTTLLLFLLITLPVTFSILKSTVFVMKGLTTQELDAELIWRYIRFAQPQSVCIDVIPTFHCGMALYFSSFLILLSLYNHGDSAQKERYLKLFLLLFTILATSLFELLNSHYFKIIFLYNLWLHRFMSYGSVITYVILAGATFYTIYEGRVNELLRKGLFLLLCFSVFAQDVGSKSYPTFWAIHFYILEVSIIYYLYTFYNDYSKNLLPRKLLVVNLIFLAGALVYLYYIATYDRFSPQTPLLGLFKGDNLARFGEVVFYKQFQCTLTHKFHKWLNFFLACGAGFGVAYLLESRLDLLRQKRGQSLAMVYVAILAVLFLGGLSRKYSAENFKESALYLYDRPLIKWARESTPEEANFLIPIYFHSWQGTKRPAFYDVNIINAASYNKTFIMDAIERFQVLMGVNLKDIDVEKPPGAENYGGWSADVFQRERYDSLSEGKILEIKANYNINYFITSSEKRYSFPIVYQNARYRVYSLD